MTSPIAEHSAWLSSCIATHRMRECPRLEPLPDGPCLAVSPVGDEVCYFSYTHGGPHSWQRLAPVVHEC
jgi:hypothetical protein